MFPNFGRILLACLQWITTYRSFNEHVEIIEIAILFFIEKILNECLNNFGYEQETLKIRSKIFKFVQMSDQSMNEEAFLTFCFS